MGIPTIERLPFDEDSRRISLEKKIRGVLRLYKGGQKRNVQKRI